MSVRKLKVGNHTKGHYITTPITPNTEIWLTYQIGKAANVLEIKSVQFSVHTYICTCTSRHPCIPLTTPVLYHELCQWIIIGLIHWKSRKKAVKSNLGKFLRKCHFNFLMQKLGQFLQNLNLLFPLVQYFCLLGLN